MTSVGKIEIPEFPKNDQELVRGSILRCTSEVPAHLGIRAGQEICVGFDGTYVRCTTAAWSIEQLRDEILNGWWEVTGRMVDLSDEEQSREFARVVEQLS